jgi:3',5'-cyclic AMP phosphodiesterase CpdA
MEGATNPGQDLYVVNNTFLNDDSSGGTFVLIGGSVTTPALLQNNIIAGTGVLTNQASAIDRTNYRAAAPAFENRANYDLRPAAGAPFINAGTAPGLSSAGVALMPTLQYKHIASTESRPVVGAIDIGAYEAPAEASLPPDPPTDVNAPTVRFIAPLDGQRTKRSIRVSLTSADNIGVTKLVLRIDGVEISTVKEPLLFAVVLSLPSGAHTLTATAFDKAGNQTTSTIRISAVL